MRELGSLYPISAGGLSRTNNTTEIRLGSARLSRDCNTWNLPKYGETGAKNYALSMGRGALLRISSEYIHDGVLSVGTPDNAAATDDGLELHQPTQLITTVPPTGPPNQKTQA